MLSDGEIRDIVNQLRDISVVYHNTQQLRARIASLIVPHLKGSHSDSAETNPVELIGAEFQKCHASEAHPRDVDTLLEALNCTLKEHGFQIVELEDDSDSAETREQVAVVAWLLDDATEPISDALKKARPDFYAKYATPLVKAAAAATQVQGAAALTDDHRQALRTAEKVCRQKGLYETASYVADILAAPAQGAQDDDILERFKNPMTPYGMLVRALRIVSGTLLMDMARDLQTTPGTLSAYECGRKPIPQELSEHAANFFARNGIPDTLCAIRAAMSREQPKGGE